MYLQIFIIVKLKGWGHNRLMSNFGAVFIFCSDLCELQIDRKTINYFLFQWFSLHFREITYAKNLIEHNRVLLFLLQRRVAKKAATETQHFLHTLFLKKKRKSVKKKMFSYQSVAHIPKIRQIWPKIKNRPKFNIRRL